MKQEYDFSNAKRGPVVEPLPDRTRITLHLDNSVLEWFRKQAHAAGGGSYEALINDALSHYIAVADKSLEHTLRRVIREELQNAG